mgnify:FL=1
MVAHDEHLLGTLLINLNIPRSPQIHKLDTLTVSLKETLASLFDGDAARTGRQIMKRNNLKSSHDIEKSKKR